MAVAAKLTSLLVDHRIAQEAKSLADADADADGIQRIPIAISNSLYFLFLFFI